jgi:N-acyl homoserine lactone hydrolase
MPALTQHGVRRVDFGHFVRPGGETTSGLSRVEPLLGYVVDHPRGLLLFDTGMGYAGAETDAHYRPRRVALGTALSHVDARSDDVRYVVNCHLHFDHCGGNPELKGRPVFTQSVELATARGEADYTVSELVDFAGVDYVELDGDTELLDGLWVIPTPGHTDGHQSLVVVCSDGTVVLAGQAHDQASEFAADTLAVRSGDAAPTRPWLDRLLEFDPRRIVFAHDHAVWTPG